MEVDFVRVDLVGGHPLSTPPFIEEETLFWLQSRDIFLHIFCICECQRWLLVPLTKSILAIQPYAIEILKLNYWFGLEIHVADFATLHEVNIVLAHAHTVKNSIGVICEKLIW